MVILKIWEIYGKLVSLSCPPGPRLGMVGLLEIKSFGAVREHSPRKNALLLRKRMTLERVMAIAERKRPSGVGATGCVISMKIAVRTPRYVLMWTAEQMSFKSPECCHQQMQHCHFADNTLMYKINKKSWSNVHCFQLVNHDSAFLEL